MTIDDDFVILDLFRNDLIMEDRCAVYMLSAVLPDGSLLPVVEERDLPLRMAKAIIELRDRA